MTFFEAEDIFSLSKIIVEFMKRPKTDDVYIKRLQFFLISLETGKIPHYIHVTGTVKGSVTNMLHSILRANGKRVGSTISPPETIITERWRVDNHIMSKAEFISLVEKIKKATDMYLRTSPYDPISFFELTTVIALLYFAEKNVEWAVVEVVVATI
jgi:folylpolyglutamate synthase/dihydropteroate synthase